MHRILCIGCRISIFGPRGAGLWTRFEARNIASKAHKFENRGYVQKNSGRHPKKSPFLATAPFIAPPVIKPGQGLKYFEDHVKDWVRDVKMQARLQAFGIPSRDLPALLRAFAAAVSSRSLSGPAGIQHYALERFSEPMHQRVNLAVLYSNVFFTWSTNPDNRDLLLSRGVQPSTMDTLHRLVEATNRMFLAEDFPLARKVCRKVIMHVGPTNSGKTYHALRALAAASTGVYAGPLRLLAHEIWERLNLGQIAPAGSEHPDFKGTELTNVIDTVPHSDAIKSHGNPMYARYCNMITGEEHKIVHENSPLLSCTVEMLPFSLLFDVAVVDEIQMISDPQRGSGWTNAVLGLPARELHLCGEETAVPVIQELLRHTGDELVIKRYERLTPLTVQEESLNGDLKNVQKGDCIVAFSRSEIFAIKRQVEEATGLRCAIIYGRLPPEIRSEQAALFNDSNSGYDVLVGSDAIGMGLNLKIRRLVFHSVEKCRSDGATEKLSISQIKQIAGRAGRYGLNDCSEAPGGFTTTLEGKDLGYLREALAAPFHDLPYARVGFDNNSFAKIIPVLPVNSSTSTIILAHHFISPLPPKIRYHDTDLDKLPLFDFIDQYAEMLTSQERVMLINAPVAWRDTHLVEGIKDFMIQARNNGRVDIMATLRTTNFMHALETIEKAKETGYTTRQNFHLLSPMESFHKLLVLYIWLTFRSPILYPESTLAVSLKGRLEVALQWALEGMSKSEKNLGKRDSALPSRRGQSPVQGEQKAAVPSRPIILSRTKAQVRALSGVLKGEHLEVKSLNP